MVAIRQDYHVAQCMFNHVTRAQISSLVLSIVAIRHSLHRFVKIRKRLVWHGLLERQRHRKRQTDFYVSVDDRSVDDKKQHETRNKTRYYFQSV